jgi:hypothetical protein
MAKKQDKADRYFQLHHYMLKTDAWRALSAPARAVYIQIGSRYNGSNNGKLALSVRDAASECNIAKDTASRALKDLVDFGFIEETRHGGLSRKTRIASEWRMMAFRCDLTEAPKSPLFMQRGAQARERRQPRCRPQPSHRQPSQPPPAPSTCPQCGKQFTPWRAKRYCSEPCHKEAENARSKAFRGDAPVLDDDHSSPF